MKKQVRFYLVTKVAIKLPYLISNFTMVNRQRFKRLTIAA